MSVSEDQLWMERRVAAESKSGRIAWLLWLVLGAFGGHRLYLQRTGTGVIMLMLGILGLLTLPIEVGAKFLTVSVIWAIIDAFFVPRMIARQHEEARERVLKEALA